MNANAGPGYVVKEWMVSPTPDAYGNMVTIVARAPGLTSKILSMVGLDATSTLRVGQTALTFEEGSPSGNITHVIAMKDVTGVTFGHAKPAVLLAMAVAMIPFSFGFSLLIFGAIYFLTKAVVLTVHARGGQSVSLRLKMGSGGGAVTPEQAAEVGRFIHGLKMSQPG